MADMFPVFLALELTRDPRKGGERVACYEFSSEESRSEWLAIPPPYTHRQRIDTTHPAARGARLKGDAPGAVRPVLVLQPSSASKAPRAPRPSPAPKSLELF